MAIKKITKEVDIIKPMVVGQQKVEKYITSDNQEYVNESEAQKHENWLEIEAGFASVPQVKFQCDLDLVSEASEINGRWIVKIRNVEDATKLEKRFAFRGTFGFDRYVGKTVIIISYYDRYDGLEYNVWEIEQLQKIFAELNQQIADFETKIA